MTKGKKKNKLQIRNSTAEFLIFSKQVGAEGIEVRLQNNTVWLTQKLISTLFEVDRSVITKHLSNIYAEGELTKETTCAIFAQVQIEGNRQITRNIEFYNLDAIIAVGYRVNSARATSFQQWATGVLRDFSLRGYVIDRKRMENGTFLGEDYFESLLAEIREIRLSERLFYQKITDIYATSMDYDKDSTTTRNFFALVQNKLHFAIHGHTAAELIYTRANAEKENMGLTSWTRAPHGKIVKTDVVVAKNYLKEQELESLGRIVNAYLDLAEDRAKRQIPMTMEDWTKRLDLFLLADDREILQNSGRITAEIAKGFAESEFEKFRIYQDKLFESDFDREMKNLKNNNKLNKPMNFVEELTWRGMIHDMMPGTEEQLKKEMTSAYVGIDPTADSLHIGHLVSVMMLRHFQRAGHRPIALVGGATGMIGDPSGKSLERNLLDETTLRHNQEAIKKQLAKFLDFESETPNAALLVNNYDWMKGVTFLDFIRDIGKHITVNYMMAKDSVKKRFSGETDGMSFTEFTYQLVQGYDFLVLYRKFGCKLQMGGSDQWGNITTGTELIRRIDSGEAFALTCPLITKADGGKFGKTESGNVWLDRRYTSPYKFYQFWLNVSDEDAEKYIKIFTALSKEEIDALVAEQKQAAHLRPLQKRLAQEVTVMVHSPEDYENAVKASELLFAKSLPDIDDQTLLEVFEGVPQFEVSAAELANGIKAVDLFAEKTAAFPSKGELRKAVQAGGISVNKIKLNTPDEEINASHLINGKYILLQKGKKNYYLIVAK